MQVNFNALPFSSSNDVTHKINQYKEDKSEEGRYIYDVILEDRHNIKTMTQLNSWISQAKESYKDYKKFHK